MGGVVNDVFVDRSMATLSSLELSGISLVTQMWLSGRLTGALVVLEQLGLPVYVKIVVREELGTILSAGSVLKVSGEELEAACGDLMTTYEGVVGEVVDQSVLRAVRNLMVFSHGRYLCDTGRVDVTTGVVKDAVVDSSLVIVS